MQLKYLSWRKDWEKRLPETKRRKFEDEPDSPIAAGRPKGVPGSPAERQRIAIERLGKSIDNFLGKSTARRKRNANIKDINTSTKGIQDYDEYSKVMREKMPYAKEGEIDEIFSMPTQRDFKATIRDIVRHKKK